MTSGIQGTPIVSLLNILIPIGQGMQMIEKIYRVRTFL